MMRKPSGYWTYDRCKEEALKYNVRNDFRKKSNSAYAASIKNNWLNNICSHMIIQGNKYKRCIYAYEFSDNSVYVGLTCDYERRHTERLNDNKDAVTIHKTISNIEPIRKQLTEYINVEEAVLMENYYVNYYKSIGWNLLNRIKTGGLGYGSIHKWSYDKCKDIALKYNTKIDFMNNDINIYLTIWKNGWVDELCSHMIILRNKNGYWTLDKCKEEAQKYINITDFQKQSNSAYKSARNSGWIDEICSHMLKKKKENNYWSFENCKKEALKYNTRMLFKELSSGAYSISTKNDWLDKICLHMIEIRKPKGYWNKEKCHDVALKYDTRKKFKEMSSGSYVFSVKNGWLDEICSHMK